MDDILKRMLAVEAQADQLSRDATLQAERILADGRRDANDLAATAQSQLADAVEALLQQRLAQAISDKKARLAAADQEMQGRLREFQDAIARRLPAVRQALLGVEP